MAETRTITNQGAPENLTLGLIQESVDAGQETETGDSFLVDLPEGTSLSTGPYTRPGVYKIGAPANSAFRFSGAKPEVDGQIVSRNGRLYLKQTDGKLIDPPLQYQMFGWANSRKTHPLLPKHFNGAESAKPLPNLEKETWIRE